VLALPLLSWLLVTSSVALAQEDPNQTPVTVLENPQPEIPPAQDDEKATGNLVDKDTLLEGRVLVTTPGGSPGSSGSKPKPNDPAAKPKPPPPPPIYWYLDERVEGDCRYSSTVAYEDFPLGVLLTYAGDNQFRNLAAFVAYVDSLPVCPRDQAPVDPSFHARVRQAYDRLSIDKPDLSFYPPEHGITGMEAYVGDANTPRQKSVVIRIDSYVLSIEVKMARVRVDWGDETPPSFYHPDYFRPYPDASLSHIYETKTCPPDYRENHPRGKLCHQSLEAYPVTVSYDWVASYTWGGFTYSLPDRDTQVVIPYDLDEIIGLRVSVN